MSDQDFDLIERDVEEFSVEAQLINEVSSSKKLERRRKIEDLFEEKRLQEELEEFG